MFRIVRVKENPSKEYLKDVVGMQLLTFKSTSGAMCVLGPINKDDIDKYWEDTFEQMGKAWVSPHYKDFLEYMLDEDCEFNSYIELDELEESRKATSEDWEAFNSTVEWFIKKHELEVEWRS